MEGALILAISEQEGIGDPALDREIVNRELRELEADILADPGPCKRWLVPVRRRRRR